MRSSRVSRLYHAMVRLLDRYYALNPVDDLGAMLGGLDTTLFADGQPADPAVTDDWMQSVNKVVGEDFSKLDSRHGLEVVLDFVKRYHSQFGFEISPVIEDLEMLKSGNTGAFLTLRDWADSFEMQQHGV